MNESLINAGPAIQVSCPVHGGGRVAKHNIVVTMDIAQITMVCVNVDGQTCAFGVIQPVFKGDTGFSIKRRIELYAPGLVPPLHGILSVYVNSVARVSCSMSPSKFFELSEHSRIKWWDIDEKGYPED